MRWQNQFRAWQYPRPLLDYYRFSRSLPQATLRLYQEDDFEACCDLYRANEKGRFPPGGLPRYQDYLRTGFELILVIEREGQVVATGGLALTRIQDRARILLLSFGLVAPEFQGQGLGTLLFCARMAYLSTWRTSKVWMISAGNGTEVFYEQLGFEGFGTFEDDDGALMHWYHVHVLGIDVIRFHRLLKQSGAAKDLDFQQALPERDEREQWRAVFEQGDGTE